MKRTVEDVMTWNVHVIGEDATFKEIVELLDECDVTGVPVIDRAGRIVGIVSESDLTFKESRGLEPRTRFEFGKRRAELAKAHGRTAKALMSEPPVVIHRGATLVEAARLMNKRGIKRIPVIDEHDKVVGIVTRRDLLKVFLRSDDEIHSEITEDVIPRRLWLSPDEGHVHVSVSEGIVTLTGTLERRTLVDILRSFVEHVDGVVAVECRVGFRTDDTKLKPETADQWGVLPRSLRRP